MEYGYNFNVVLGYKEMSMIAEEFEKQGIRELIFEIAEDIDVDVGEEYAVELSNDIYEDLMDYKDEELTFVVDCIKDALKEKGE